jgi:hypothetical protein
MGNMVKACVGSVTISKSGHVNDYRRMVDFEAEQIASCTECVPGPGEEMTDCRGLAETLYITADLRFVVHLIECGNSLGWQCVYTLVEASEQDLQRGGRFEKLGFAAMGGRPFRRRAIVASAFLVPVGLTPGLRRRL